MSKSTELYACLYAWEFPAQAMLRLRADLRDGPCVILFCSRISQCARLGKSDSCLLDLYERLLVLNEHCLATLQTIKACEDEGANPRRNLHTTVFY
jgi:hypothetical protein